MRRAWESTKKESITSDQVSWKTESVGLRPAAHLTQEKLTAYMMATNQTFITRGAATRLAWVKRCEEGRKIQLSCLSLGGARVLHMPGELFVEYQLAAKAERPDLFVAMAAYGDYAPWYIGTSKSYEEGGYETSEGATNVGPDAEPILRRAIFNLLRD